MQVVSYVVSSSSLNLASQATNLHASVPPLLFASMPSMPPLVPHQGHKGDWEALAGSLKGLQSSSSSAGGWQQRAKDAEYQLFKLLNLVLDLPDPSPFLANAAALSTKIVGACPHSAGL